MLPLVVLTRDSWTVVVLGANAGGSASPPERLHLVVLDPDGESRIEMDPAFRSTDGTERVASDGTRLWFDLGYDDHSRKIGVFDGESLRIEYRDVGLTPVARDSCEAAHATLFDCIQRGRGKDYSTYSLSEFLRVPGSLSTASRGPLLRLSNHPGFDGEAYMSICSLAASTGVDPGYDTFESLVCIP